MLVRVHYNDSMNHSAHRRHTRTSSLMYSAIAKVMNVVRDVRSHSIQFLLRHFYVLAFILILVPGASPTRADSGSDSITTHLEDSLPQGPSCVLTATANTINVGESVKLIWTSRNAVSLSGPAAGRSALVPTLNFSGQELYQLFNAGTYHFYILVVSKDRSTATCQAAVTVN
jgi:hypothetical protein